MNDKLTSVFVKEQRHYSKTELRSLFECDEDKCRKIIRKLKEQGVVKPYIPDKDKDEIPELSEDDYEIGDNVSDDEIGYIFRFVGVVSLFDTVIKIFPKYISESDEDKLSSALKQIIKVLIKYNSKYSELKLYTESDGNIGINKLPLMIYFLNDYFEKGIYTNDISVLEVNGEGEIIWERTINDTFALISNNKPYYPEMITRRRKTNDFDFFRRLHAAIVSECSDELDKSGLTELFDFEKAEITDETISELGDAEFLLNRIEKELNIQFNTRKQILLKAMYTYIANNVYGKDDDAVHFFGTNSFHTVWEKVCSYVFDNQLQKKLKDIEVPYRKIADGFNSSDTLLGIIDKPDWAVLDNNGNIQEIIKASDTLIPDCVFIKDDIFVILDAKYYRIKIENGKIKGQPGIGDITKQHLYELVYREFLVKHGFDTNKVRNCFLVPVEQNEITDIIIAEFKPISVPLKLHPVQVKGIPAKPLFDKYLKGKKYTITDLKLG